MGSMPARPRIVKLQNYSWAKYWLTAKGARPEVGGLYCIMNKPILYVIVFIIVLCQRWCGVDDCVVLDVEGAGL